MSLVLQLETVDTCNAACHFCDYPKLNRRGDVMSMDLYRKIIDEARTIPEVETVILQGLGEPLLDPYLEERLDYARGMQTVIFTNGLLLSQDRFRDMVGAGLQALVVSLNANTPEQHKAAMGVGGFQKVVNACEAFRDGPIDFSVHAVCDGECFTRADAQAFLDRWGVKGRGGVGMVIRQEMLESDTIRPECCQRAITQVYVLWDGRVTMCCLDQTGKTVWGDLGQQSLREVYNSDGFTQFREDHWNNRADKHEECARCVRA